MNVSLVLTLLTFFYIIWAPVVSSANEQAQLLFKQEKYDEVISLLRPEADTLSPKSLLLLAKAYNKTRDYLNEFRVLSNITTVDEKNYEAYTGLGHYYIRNKDWKKAGESFRQSLSIKKNYRPAYDGLIAVYTEKTNNYELRQIYTDMQSVFGDKSDILTNLCRLHALENLFDTALDACNKAIRKHPSNPENHVYLAQVLHYKGDKKQATKILKKTAEKHPNSEIAQLVYADTLFKDSNFAVAEKYYLAAMKANPNSAFAARGAAQNFIELKKYDRALETYKIACSLDPHSTIKEIRKAHGTIRRANLTQWDSKFTAASESCMK